MDGPLNDLGCAFNSPPPMSPNLICVGQPTMLQHKRFKPLLKGAQARSLCHSSREGCGLAELVRLRVNNLPKRPGIGRQRSLPNVLLLFVTLFGILLDPVYERSETWINA